MQELDFNICLICQKSVGKKSFISALSSSPSNEKVGHSSTQISLKDFRNEVLINLNFIEIDMNILQKFTSYKDHDIS